jgi:hypothetical protein
MLPGERIIIIFPSKWMMTVLLASMPLLPQTSAGEIDVMVRQ